MNHQALSSFIWSVADLLRGDYKQSDYGKVILPFTVLRRLDCVLEAKKAADNADSSVDEGIGAHTEDDAREKTKRVIARKLKRSVDAISRLGSTLGVMLGWVEGREGRGRPAKRACR
jgi:type I restriction-modification system DNA methylase subunit